MNTRVCPFGDQEGQPAETSPAQIDIEMIAGPEAGNTCYGIFTLERDELALCLGLVGATRPQSFATHAGSGHALEHLRRVSDARPEGVAGGTAPSAVGPGDTAHADPAAFACPVTPLIRSLQGQWVSVEVVANGKRLPEHYLTRGLRTMTGTEVEVAFGGQTMVRAKVRIDETRDPIAIDYCDLRAEHIGELNYGIMEWVGEDVRFLMAAAGDPRPTSFDEIPTAGTLSRWRRRGDR
jgi:uncharacterized protein (TIGR03067 family)